jgi:hypothetical protein
MAYVLSKTNAELLLAGFGVRVLADTAIYTLLIAVAQDMHSWLKSYL